MAFDFQQDYFSLFDVPRQFRTDIAAVESAFRTRQSVYHPDKVASLGDGEKREAMQIATHLNQAMQTLKFPVSRARYLLALAGVDTKEETTTAMPLPFLMQQMAWREEVAEAQASKDVDALEEVARQLRQEEQQLLEQLAIVLDDEPALAEAALIVRKLRFYEKLDQDIGEALDSLLD